MDNLPMICYLFDEKTGVYLNRSKEAVPDPKVKGLYNIPNNATLIPPPSLPDPWTQVAVNREGKWQIEQKASVILTDDSIPRPGMKQVQVDQNEISQRR